MSNKLKIGFNNGDFTEISKISIPVDNITVNRGYGAFDFFGIINKKPFYLERHLDRFFNSLNLLRLKIDYDRKSVKSLIEQVVNQNENKNYFIKIFALPLFSDTARELKSGFYIVPVDIDPFDKQIYLNGGSLITKEYSRFLPEAKSTSYLPLIFWYPEISDNNAVDVLYTSNNTIQETSRGNIFMIKNGVVYTAESSILKGITRSVVIDILVENKIPFRAKQINVLELFDADEVFITSTTKKILPIVKIDGNKIGIGNVGSLTKQLMQEFSAYQNTINL